MADPNQKLFSQIADLGRNINSLSESIKKNTSATESLFSATEKSDKKEKESATAPNKGATANPKEGEKNEGAIKDLTKVISKLLGEGGPLMSKIAGISKNSGGDGSNKDFTNIAGGLKGIIKAFQEGGVAQKEGKYLVGENGPEVVKLPKGAGVIPINIKDLMEGLKKVPEFSSILKNSKNDSLDFFGNSGNPGLIDSDGMIMNLRRLSDKYSKLGDDAKDDETRKSMDSMMETIDSLMEAGRDGIDEEVSKIDAESATLANKNKLSGEDLQKRDKLWDEILKNVTKDNDYYNILTISKAKLLATQSLTKGEAKKPEESVSEVKQQAEDLKKSEEVVNPTEVKKEKKGLFSKSKKEKQPEKVESLESLAAKEPIFGNKTEEVNNDNSKQENKKPSLLSKVGKSAEGALFSAAGAATDKLGIASPLAKKGLGALKKSIGNKGKESEPKSAENKTELSKGTAKTPSLVSDVKKLAPTAKNESKAESKEAPESKSSPKATSSESTPKETPKSESSKKSESKGESTSELGTSKDVQDIKNALTRIASILEGTLTVSPIESPFRPDSRRI
jgi:hypothetical protein